MHTKNEAQVIEAPGYKGIDRRREFQDWRARVDEQFGEGRVRMDSFETLLKSNTELTEKTSATVDRIDTNTAGFIAFSNDLVSGTKFLCRCAKGVQWAGEMVRGNWFVLLAVAVIYAYTTNQAKLLEFLVSLAKP